MGSRKKEPLGQACGSPNRAGLDYGQVEELQNPAYVKGRRQPQRERDSCWCNASALIPAIFNQCAKGVWSTEVANGWKTLLDPAVLFLEQLSEGTNYLPHFSTGRAGQAIRYHTRAAEPRRISGRPIENIHRKINLGSPVRDMIYGIEILPISNLKSPVTSLAEGLCHEVMLFLELWYFGLQLVLSPTDSLLTLGKMCRWFVLGSSQPAVILTWASQPSPTLPLDSALCPSVNCS